MGCRPICWGVAGGGEGSNPVTSTRQNPLVVPGFPILTLDARRFPRVSGAERALGTRTEVARGGWLDLNRRFESHQPTTRRVMSGIASADAESSVRSQCAYTDAVTCVFSCPSLAAISVSGLPESKRIEAWRCRI